MDDWTNFNTIMDLTSWNTPTPRKYHGLSPNCTLNFWQTTALKCNLFVTMSCPVLFFVLTRCGGCMYIHKCCPFELGGGALYVNSSLRGRTPVVRSTFTEKFLFWKYDLNNWEQVITGSIFAILMAYLPRFLLSAVLSSHGHNVQFLIPSTSACFSLKVMSLGEAGKVLSG